MSAYVRAVSRRMPAQGQRGSRSAPQRHPCGSRLVVGRVHIAETPEGPPRQSGAAREEQGRVEQNFFSVPLARTTERRQTSITSSRNTKGDAPMGIAFWWWEEVDSNYRSRRRQIYSLIHLAALESSRIMKLEHAPRGRVELVIGIEPTTC